jgi:uncharacterized SAM-binding protein YcdF (DUF218 family)
MLFALKKIITSMVLPPGIFILCFAVFSGYLRFRKERIWKLSLAVSIIFYLLSIPLTGSRLISFVEYPNDDMNSFKHADVIVVAGGGVTEGVKDLSGVSIPANESALRVLDAVRLHRIYHKPIIITGGSAAGSEAEAFVDARFLKDCGVSNKDIILEDQARDTEENARYVKQICDAKKFRSVLLVTSAFHAKRAKSFFEREGLKVFVYPSGSMNGKKSLAWIDFLPSPGALRVSALAIREIVGAFL